MKSLIGSKYYRDKQYYSPYLGKIDIKEKRFFGVGHLNSVLLGMFGARDNRSDGSFSGHISQLGMISKRDT